MSYKGKGSRDKDELRLIENEFIVVFKIRGLSVPIGAFFRNGAWIDITWFYTERFDDVRCQLTIDSYSRMSVMTDVECDSEQEAGTSGVIIRWKSGEIFVFIVGSSGLC